MKIENQKQYEAQIELFKEYYFKEFKEWVSPPDCDKNNNKTRFLRDFLEPKLNNILTTENIKEVQDFRNQKKWLYGTKTFEAVEMFCRENDLISKFQFIIQSLAEYDAILNVYDDLNSSTKEKQLQTLNNEPNNEIEINIFCQKMPIEIPINHFKVFTERNSKNGNPFLSMDQFNFFIAKAFKGEKNLKKGKFNLSNKEKLFIVKRFYQFYLLATNSKNRYESTLQCKDKYIRLLSDNFDNWDYKSLKNNFGNKVKREW